MKLIRISSVWCSSCIITHKNWKNLKIDYPNYEYEEYDYDDDIDEIKEYNVGNILPVIIVFDNNKEIFRFVGERPKKEVENYLEKVGK